jgi:hypothetical protein
MAKYTMLVGKRISGEKRDIEVIFKIGTKES